MADTTDPVATWIADTRAGKRGVEWPADVERLLAALDAVLALCREPGSMVYSGTLNEAISAALLGEGESGG